MSISEVIAKFGFFPVPEFVGEWDTSPCAFCGDPANLAYYVGDNTETGKKCGFTACDNLCAGMAMAEVLSALPEYQD